MEIQLLELVLWAGLVFFFWALKDNLGKVERDLESRTASRHPFGANPGRSLFSKADRLYEPIGSYRDHPIYRIIVVGGQRYCFDSVCPVPPQDIDPGAVCIAPGLLYRLCSGNVSIEKGEPAA